MYSATNFSYGEDVAEGELDDEDGDELGDAAEDDMIQVRFRFSPRALAVAVATVPIFYLCQSGSLYPGIQLPPPEGPAFQSRLLSFRPFP